MLFKKQRLLSSQITLSTYTQHIIKQWNLTSLRQQWRWFTSTDLAEMPFKCSLVIFFNRSIHPCHIPTKLGTHVGLTALYWIIVRDYCYNNDESNKETYIKDSCFYHSKEKYLSVHCWHLQVVVFIWGRERWLVVLIIIIVRVISNFNHIIVTIVEITLTYQSSWVLWWDHLV